MEGIIWKNSGEIIRLKALLTTAAEELHRLNANCPDLMSVVENSEREWLPSYSIGGYNQMRMYIKELETYIDNSVVETLRSNRHKYLVDWFEATDPKCEGVL